MTTRIKVPKEEILPIIKDGEDFSNEDYEKYEGVRLDWKFIFDTDFTDDGKYSNKMMYFQRISDGEFFCYNLSCSHTFDWGDVFWGYEYDDEIELCPLSRIELIFRMLNEEDHRLMRSFVTYLETGEWNIEEVTQQYANILEDYGLEPPQKGVIDPSTKVCKGCEGCGTVLVLDFTLDDPIQPCPICSKEES